MALYYDIFYHASNGNQQSLRKSNDHYYKVAVIHNLNASTQYHISIQTTAYVFPQGIKYIKSDLSEELNAFTGKFLLFVVTLHLSDGKQLIFEKTALEQFSLRVDSSCSIAD